VVPLKAAARGVTALSNSGGAKVFTISSKDPAF
jgi:hypothetical protein